MASYPSITRTRRNRLHESTCSPVRSSPCQVAKTGDASISSLVSSASRFFSIHRHILYPSLCIYTCTYGNEDGCASHSHTKHRQKSSVTNFTRSSLPTQNRRFFFFFFFSRSRLSPQGCATTRPSANKDILLPFIYSPFLPCV